MILQDVIQDSSHIRMELGPSFAATRVELWIGHHLMGHGEAILKLSDELGPELVLIQMTLGQP